MTELISKPNIYEHEGVTVYRASALGRCLRSLTALRQGYEPHGTPSVMQEVFQRGIDAEPKILAWLEERGWLTAKHQQMVELRLPNNVCIRGHIDGQGFEIRDPLTHIVECKSTTRPGFIAWQQRRWEAQPTWAWQVSAYMHALDMPAVMAVMNVDAETVQGTGPAGRLVEQSGPGTVLVDAPEGDIPPNPALSEKAVDVFYVSTPPKSLEQIMERVRSIEEALPLPVGHPDFPACSSRDFPCPTFTICSHRTEISEDSDLDQLCILADHCRSEKDQWSESERKAKELIIAHLDREGVDKVATADWLVTRSHSTRHQVDKDKAREAGIDLSLYERATPYVTLRVTRRGKDSHEPEARS